MTPWLTNTLAVFGAVAGAISLFLNLRTARKDRAELKITAGVVESWSPATGPIYTFEMEVVNHGRRTARIIKVGIRPCVEDLSKLGARAKSVTENKLKFLGTQFHLFQETSNEVIALGEGDRHVFKLPLREDISEQFIGGKGIAFLRDSLGNEQKLLFQIPHRRDQKRADDRI